MNPDRHATSHYDYFKNLIKGDDTSTEAHRKFYDEYNAVLDMDAEYYLDTIKTVFQEFKLVKGTWDVMSVEGKLERVTPGDIKTTAVMTVEGELDDISGSGQTRAALEMCSGVAESAKTHLEAKGAGHYGIFSGRRWRDVVYPAVHAFILEQNQSLNQAGAAPVAVTKPVTPAIAPTAEAKTPAALESANKVAPKAHPAAHEPTASTVKKVVKTSPAVNAHGSDKPVTKPVLVAVAQTPTAASTTKATGIAAAKEKPVPPEKSAA